MILQPVLGTPGAVGWLAILIGAIIALSGCSSSAPATSSATESALATATPIPTIAATPTAAPTPTVVDGTWEVTVTRAEILAAGIVDAEEDNPGNYGHFTLSIHGGTCQVTHLEGGEDSCTYVIQGMTILFTNAAGEGPFAYPFTVSSATLTFLPFLTSTGAVDLTRSGPVTFRTKPWTRVGP